MYGQYILFTSDLAIYEILLVDDQMFFRQVCLSLVAAACAKPSAADLDRILEVSSARRRGLGQDLTITMNHTT